MGAKAQSKKTSCHQGKIDWITAGMPFMAVVVICVLFFLMPERSNDVLEQIRFLTGDAFGAYYLIIGFGIFLLSLFLAGSKYGTIETGIFFFCVGFHDVYLRAGG